MAEYRVSDLQHVRDLGFRKPTILLKVYGVCTLTGQSAHAISVKSRTAVQRVTNYLRRLAVDDYIEVLPGKPTLYRRNGRNPITEDHWIWRAQLENVHKLFNNSNPAVNPTLATDTKGSIILWINSRTGEFTARDIHRETDMIRANVSSYINRLIKDGLIEKVRREGPHHHYVYRKTEEWNKHHGP